MGKKIDIEKIVTDYSGYVYTIIKNRMNQNISNEDMEEIIADTFFVLWKNQANLGEETKVSSYLAGIVRNLLKEKARDIKFNDNILDYENILISKGNLVEILEEKQQIERIEKSLQNMKEEDINIFKAYYYAGKKIKQIAQELNMTEFKIKTKLHRIRKKIKKDLCEGGYEYGK